MMLAAFLLAAAVPATADADLAMLERLVAFQTVAGKGQVPAMAEWLRGEFRSAGFSPDDISIELMGDSAALTVRYRGRSGGRGAPIVLLAHMDVVDARRDEWQSDPWTLTERDGKLFGRGVVDNKYGVLTIARAFIRLKHEGFVPRRDVIAAFTGDEETAMLTTRRLAERLRGVAFAVNADAGGGFRPGGSVAPFYYVQAGEKTYVSFDLVARGPGGHSSAPGPDNPIDTLASALQKVAALRFPVRWNAVSLETMRRTADTQPEGMREAMQRFVATPGDPAAVAVLEADPFINRDLRTTCVATVLRAGDEENVLPTLASATVNCRAFPGETIAEVRAALASAIGDDRVTIGVRGETAESPMSTIPPDATRALERVLAVRAPGAGLIPYIEAGGTDGLHFRRAGIPTIGAGPLFSAPGTSHNYHAANENLPVEQFVDGLDHFYRMIRAF